MNKHERLKQLVQKYKHAWVFLYGFIYMPWFLWLEHHVTTDYHVIHSALDDKIPFLEVFIIPYLLWFVFIAAVVLYFFFTDVPGFYRLCTMLFTGMTIFLIISTLFPNGLALRPTVFERDNIFVHLVQFVYRADTSTNVFPSIHVYNSLAACVAISHSEVFKKHKALTVGSYILAASIILATMFLKQHSVIDVSGAFVMAYAVYQFVYAPSARKVPKLSRQPV